MAEISIQGESRKQVSGNKHADCIVPGFIVFEGAHGSGKTTQAKLLLEWLHDQPLQAVYIKTPATHALRTMAEQASSVYGQQEAELAALLLAADRCIVQKRIRHLVKDGVIVIVDRWLPSSVVYQGLQGLSRRRVLQINKGIDSPDLSVFLMCSLAIRTDRLIKGGRNRRGSLLNEDGLKCEQELYGKFCRSRKGKETLVFDGSGDKAVIHERIRTAILKQWGQ